jgi:MFS family permease
VSTAAAAHDDEPRFRDTVRGLPPRVWIVSLGILVNRAGNFLPVFIVLYLTTQHYSPGAAGLVLAAAGLGNVLGNTVGGHLADRLGRRWTIVLSGCATAGLTAAIPMLATLPSIITAVGLVGAASQVYRPAAGALLVDSVTTSQQRVAAFAVFRFAMNIGAAAGGALGGLLAATSYTWLFLANALACLLFAAIAALLLRDVPRSNSRKGLASEAKEKAAYRQVIADRRLLRFLVMTFVAEFVYIQSTVGLPLHVHAVGLTAASFGLLIGLNGLLVLVFELPITGAVSRRRPEYVLAIGNLLTGVGLALTGFATGMVLLCALVLMWTLGEMMYSSMANAYIGGLAPPSMVGRYQGLYGAVVTLGTGIGAPIGGVIYAGNPWALWTLIGIAGLLSAQLCLPTRRSPATVAGAEEPRPGYAEAVR